MTTEQLNQLTPDQTEELKETPMQQESTFNEPDPFYADAVEYVQNEKKVSVTMIQRHFRLGYNRAYRLIESMEKEGVISAIDNKGSRKVLKF